MTAHDAQKRQTAIRLLINLAIAEAMLVGAVILAWITFDSVALLVGGLIGAQFIFVPMFLRWAREHGAHLRSGEDR